MKTMQTSLVLTCIFFMFCFFDSLHTGNGVIKNALLMVFSGVISSISGEW